MRNVMTSIATAGLLFVVAGCSSSPPRYGYADPDAFTDWVLRDELHEQR